MSGQLDVLAEIETPSGWLSLEDPAGGYELHKDAFASRSTSSRKLEIESDWVEGSYTARAVRGNVTETLAVWIEGPTPYVREARTDAVIAGLEQLQYRFRLTHGNHRETWTCFYTDYQIESSQELRFSNLVVLRASIPRLPSIIRELVP